MKSFLNFLVLSTLILVACSKDDDKETSYPFELVPYTELKDMKLNVGGTDQTATGISPDKLFDKEDLGKDYYYIKLKSDSELTLAFDGEGGDSYDLPYSFRNDSMVVVTDVLEEGSLFLGKGSRSSLAKQCGAFMFYGYRMKDGQKEDINRDEIVNEDDKIRITSMKDGFLTINDVLSVVGYTSLSQLEAKDSILIYNYTLKFVKDLDGDRLYTNAD